MTLRAVGAPSRRACGARWLRRIRRHFSSQTAEPRSIPTMLRDQWLATERLAVVVRMAYIFPAFWMTRALFTWQDLVTVQHPMWLWPVAWLAYFDETLAPKLLLGACVAGAWITSAWSTRRWARVFALLCLLEFLGLCFATGKIHHLMHGWVFVLASFVLLPHGWHAPTQLTRAARVQALLTYGLAQSLFALTYALSGVGKALGIVYQAWRGEVTGLHPEAFSRHVAARLLETGDVSLLGNWVVWHGQWLWPLVVATMYLQLCALHFAARPNLHRLLAFGLVGFHVMSAATLHIDFTPAIVLAGLLFGASATAPLFSWRSLLRDVPVFGRFFRRGMTADRKNVRPAAPV